MPAFFLVGNQTVKDIFSKAFLNLKILILCKKKDNLEGNAITA